MKTSLELLEWERFCALLSEYAECALGRDLIHRLKPYRSRQDLDETFHSVEEGASFHLDHQEPLLGGASDLSPLFKAIRDRGIGLDGKELFQFAATLASAERLRDHFIHDAGRPVLRAQVQRLPALRPLERRISQSIDSSGQVQDGADPVLFSLRDRIGRKEHEVRWIAQRIAQRSEWQSILRTSVPVLRDGRFMLSVRAESRGQIPGVFHDRSASGASVFVEPAELVEPQNELADLRADERKKVAQILLDLSREVLRCEGEIHESLRILARLDAVFARVRYMKDSSSRLLPIAADGVLSLHRAFHPLLLARDRDRQGTATGLGRARERVVPFDLCLGERFDALVITGPNTGGKTATLKAVGLISLMALAAVPCPVDGGGQVPFYDEVLADIGDEQDLQQNLSTFSGHLRHIVDVLQKATRKSLVLLDELGSGTDPKEGEALGDALLRELLERGSRVIATTHLSGLKDLGFEHPRVENASLEFDPASLRPLYRLTMGLPGESNALLIARRLGIPGPVVERAALRLAAAAGAEAAKISEQVLRSRAAVQRHLDRAEEEQRLLSQKSEDLERRSRELEERTRLLEKQMEAETERALRQAQNEGERLIREIGTLPGPIEQRLEPLKKFLQSLPARSLLAQRRTAFVLSRKKDDVVYLPRYRESCRVRKVDRARQILTVLYRSLPMAVAFDEVLCPEDFEP